MRPLDGINLDRLVRGSGPLPEGRVIHLLTQLCGSLHEAHGLTLSLPDYCHHAGMYGSWDAMYAELSRHCGVPAEELHAVRNPRFRELVQACLQPAPELIALLHELSARGVKRGIASSSDSDWVDYLVDGHLHHPHGDHCDDHGPVTVKS